jgi:hypothetical protein
VIVIANQNFPAVLPSVENKCLVIVRLQKGCLNELVDFALNIKKCVGVPSGKVILIGSISHLESVGTQLYATACVNAKCRLLGNVRWSYLSPPPLEVATIRN